MVVSRIQPNGPRGMAGHQPSTPPSGLTALGRHLGLVFSHTTRTIGLYPLYLKTHTECLVALARSKHIFFSKSQHDDAMTTIQLRGRNINSLSPHTVHSGKNFQKLWTSVAHSFLQQIAQNKNWAHPKATALHRIYKVEMEHASLLFYLAKPQSWGILGCDLRHCTSEPFDFRRFVEACRAYGGYSQYSAWSRCCRTRSADVPRADRDHVGWSLWQRGFKERDTLLAILPFVWFFRYLKM